MILTRRFFAPWLTFCLGAFSDNVLRQSLIIGISFGSITLADGAFGDSAVPIIGALFALAIFLFSPLAGQFADKFETARMFRRTKLAELVIILIAAFGFIIDNAPLVVITLFLMAAQSAFFSPVRIGAMPKYFAAKELLRANAFFSAGLFVSILCGLALGGFLITQAGGRYAVATALVCASTLGWLSSLAAPRAEENAPNLEIEWNPLKEALRLFTYVAKEPPVIHPIFGIAFFYFTSTHITVLAPLYVRDSLGADDIVANTLTALFAIGAGFGALSASLLSKGRSGLGLALFGLFAATIVTYGTVYLTPMVAGQELQLQHLTATTPGIGLVLCMTLSAAFMSLYTIPLQAALQRRASAQLRARIVAASNMTNAAAATLGSLSTMIYTQTSLGYTDAFFAIATIQLLVVLYMFQRRVTLPDGTHDEGLMA